MQIDVVDLCALLECIGLKINTVENTADPPAQDAKGGNEVTIECKYSRLRVTMDSSSTVCSCPKPANDMSSSCWKVSSVAHGVHEENRETGSNLLSSLPIEAKKIMTRELYKIIQFSRAYSNETVPPNPRPSLQCTLFQDINFNCGALSLNELNVTPPTDDKQCSAMIDAPAMYRSLDTLTNGKDQPKYLPTPRKLSAKKADFSNTTDILEDLPDKSNFEKKKSFGREYTYMVPLDERSNSLMKSKTSSPICKMSETMLKDLLHAEETAIMLRDKLHNIVKEVLIEDKTPNDSMVSLNLDVSKISTCKVEHETKNIYVSSPNLASLKRNKSNSNLKKTNSKSTTQLCRQQTPTVSKVPTRLRKLSPNHFMNKGDNMTKSQVLSRNLNDRRNDKPHSRIVTPVIRNRLSSGGSVTNTPTNNKINTSPLTCLSSSRKQKYSHIKSTIPKPTQSMKKE